MSRYGIMMALAGAAAVWCAAPLAVTHAAQASAGDAAWGPAIEVPGLGALNAGGNARVRSVSCASAGNCAADGSYADRSGREQAFVVSQRNGHWRKAIKVPGTAELGVSAVVGSVSCGSAGNCADGGIYADRSGREQAFVVSQRNGRWGTAIEVPGTAALNAGGFAEVNSVSCGSAGNCAAGGTYADGPGPLHRQAFVASQRNGRWGTAIKVPGTAALNAGGSAEVRSVSCASAGNCAAAGTYADRSRREQAFVASQRNGRWGTAIEVPGTAALSKGGLTFVASVSCGSAGNCAVGGYYFDRSLLHLQAFVASQRNGRWGTAIKVPGMAALSKGGRAVVNSVSCGSAGNCMAGGLYTDRVGLHVQAFVVSQRNGRWGTAIKVPGMAALSAGGSSQVISVSCSRAGPCAAGGHYTDRSRRHLQAFVVSQRNGRWGTAIEVPGTGRLNAGGNAEVVSVSCSRAGPCAAYGFYTNGSGALRGFVVSQS